MYPFFNIIIVDNSRNKQDLSEFNRNCLKHGRHLQIIDEQENEFSFNREIYWYKCSDNLGYAGGMNLGSRLAEKGNPDFLLLLNNDTLVSQRFFDDLLAGIETVVSNQDFGFAGCLIRNWPNKEVWYAGGMINLNRCMGEHFTEMPHNNSTIETDFITGCCMICRPEVYKELEGMDENFFLYMEDVDLCYRARKAGFKLYFVPQAGLHHRVGSSTGGDEKALSVYYSSRNRMLLMRKHFGGIHFLRFFLFFLFSRLLKTTKWLILGKVGLIASLWKGMIEGCIRKI